MSKGKKLSVLKKNSTNNPKNEKYQFLVFIKVYILMMSILFFFIVYDRFTDFILVGVLFLTIHKILSVKWDRWWIIYSLFLVVATILGRFSFEAVGIFSSDATFSQTDAESARYLISALIQSEAAIIAIVITLSLVAVQQTSSSYSARVIDIFKSYRNNHDFFILMIVYITSIVYGALLLKTIKNQTLATTNTSLIVNPSLEFYIWLAYILCIFSLLSLFPYILNTLDMFKPSTLIKRLSENISKESIERAIECENSNNEDRNGQIQPINDTIQPIVDVLQGSMKSYDYEITRYGLKKLENKTIQILIEEIDDTYKDVIANRIIGHIKSIGIIATKQEMERSVNDTVDTFQRIYNCLIEKKIYKPIDALVSALLKIGEQTINMNLESSTIYVLQVLNEIGIKSINVDDKEITEKVISSIGKIAIENSMSAFQSSNSVACWNAIQFLEDLGTKTAEKKWEYETLRSILGFRLVGETLIENTVITRNVEELIKAILNRLYLISIKLIENNLKLSIMELAKTIHSIGIRASVKNSELTKVASEIFSDSFGSSNDRSDIPYDRKLYEYLDYLQEKLDSKLQDDPDSQESC